MKFRTIFRHIVQGDITKIATYDTPAFAPLQRSTARELPTNENSLGNLSSPLEKLQKHSGGKKFFLYLIISQEEKKNIFFLPASAHAPSLLC